MSVKNLLINMIRSSVNLDVFFFWLFLTGDWVMLIYLGGEKSYKYGLEKARKAIIMISCDRTKAAVSSPFGFAF